MTRHNIKIFPLGDNALTISFGNEISPEMNSLVLSLAQFCSQNQFPGFIEMVPAYASLSIFFDVPTVRKSLPEFSAAFEAVKRYVENALLKMQKIHEQTLRTVKIPVSFDKEVAPDLEFVASANNLMPPDVIKIFTERVYRVYMLGFLPGFAYMGKVDERIATPRKPSPRLEVPRGSVGIAGGQTGIYSLASPGGWQIIGRTAVELFMPGDEKPSLFQAGDLVKFYPVDDFKK